VKTVIVGNGIVALTAALRIAQRGGEVAIIGDPARQGSATLAAAAMLNSFAELDTSSLATPIDRDKFSLSRSATERWHELAAELAITIDTGTCVLGGADDPDFESIVTALREHGEPHALIDPDRVPGYAPVRRAARAVRIDREGWTDPRAAVAALERVLVVERIAGVARRLRGDGVELADGRLIAGTHYLLANGASLTALLAASDLPLRVQPVRYGVGTTLELAIAGHTACLRAPGVYSVPRGDRVVIGSTNLVVDAPVDDPTAAARILATASEQLDARFVASSIVRANVGWRPTGLDPYPLIGRTSLPNVLIASGTRRDGFHLAPVIADHLADLLDDRPGDSRFTAFHPERAPSS
jgi:glycine oxidase